MNYKDSCFPLRCKAMVYCDKFNIIPIRYDSPVRDLSNSKYCIFKKAYYKYLSSVKWINKRNNVLKYSGFKCQKCNTKELLQVHHLNYNNVFNETANDLVVLCYKCHRDQHNITNPHEK